MEFPGRETAGPVFEQPGHQLALRECTRKAGYPASRAALGHG